MARICLTVKRPIATRKRSINQSRHFSHIPRKVAYYTIVNGNTSKYTHIHTQYIHAFYFCFQIKNYSLNMPAGSLC